MSQQIMLIIRAVYIVFILAVYIYYIDAQYTMTKNNVKLII